MPSPFDGPMIDWYDCRDQLRPGMVFRTYDGHVKLEGRTEGDGTKWDVLTWYPGRPDIKGYEHGRWSCDEGTVEPGDLLEQMNEEDLAKADRGVEEILTPDLSV